MKRIGYKANRPTAAEDALRCQRIDAKARAEMIARRKRVAEKRAAKGLPPRVYKTRLPGGDE